VDLGFDEAAPRTLSPFNKAAVTVIQARLEQLETLTRGLFMAIADIRDFGKRVDLPDVTTGPDTGFIPDPDRLTGAVHAMAIMWVAWLAYIYVSDFPGGAGFVIMSSVFAMIVAGTPQLPVSVMFKPVAGSILFGGLVYIFVLPKLSSFLLLGPLIFAVTFGICYLLASPRQALSRVFALVLFVSIASISNQQSYSFLVVANISLQFTLVLMLLAFMAYLPFSARPERAILHLLRRFFRSAGYLTSTLGSEPPTTRLDRWREAFHVHEVSTLPHKLGAWTKFMNTTALPGTSPQDVQALLTSLLALSYRMRGLLEERGSVQSRFLVQHLLTDLRAWRVEVQENFQRLSRDPAGGEHEVLRSRLDAVLDDLEARVQKTVDQADEDQLTARDGESFYRALGAFRSVSEALVDYAGKAGTIDWMRWREERFT